MHTAQFAGLVRLLANAARAEGLTPPSFRAPPRSGDRSLRRRPDGSMVVAVRIRGRELGDVVDDMVDGILAANDAGADVERRARLVEVGWGGALLEHDAERGP